MARNDIERALRDGVDAAKEDRQDFSYRVRLVTSHLVEALDSVNAYAKDSSEVRKLMAQVPPEQRRDLKAARSVIQKIGAP